MDDVFISELLTDPHSLFNNIVIWPGGTAEGGPPECLPISKITGEEAVPGPGQSGT